jgi:ATP-dependent RNA helicase HelY
VLVAAPTGSGKTVVAEHAIDLALGRDGGHPRGKVFYTTPIKALSNQKFRDLVARLGADRVGLLTGDNAVNADAPVVVMTTEVLRNMIYAASPALEGLAYVVLDEVHYLQDPYRGPVWEEVIIHAPPDVRLVALSATVSNAAELAEWMATVRGPTATVVEERRPVDLINLYAAWDRTSRTLVVLPTLVDGRSNPRGEKLDSSTLGSPRQLRGRPRSRYASPRRLEVVERLADDDLLPAIYFVFSRAGCDEAASHLRDAGVRLTTVEERRRIRAVADERTALLSDRDLDLLGYDGWLAGLEQGVAAHHAGMVPPFKEVVEVCFTEGLVKVVFATETLALGINMPARSVVIESMTKFTGERHEFLTPAEYTQLTGRAGRRGIDAVGHAMVLWSPFVGFEQVATLAASRRFSLASSFRPTYNMAANLVRRYEEDEAHHLLNQSFAQFQADRSVVRLEARRVAQERKLAELQAEARCERGDVEELRTLLQAHREAGAAVPGRASRRGLAEALSRLRPGDVVDLGPQRAAVISVADRGADRVKVRAITPRAKVLHLDAADLDDAPPVVGEVTLPMPFAPNNHAFQHQVARELRHLRSPRRTRRRPDQPDASSPVAAHPVSSCPDRSAHLRAAAQADRVRRELGDLARRIDERTGSVARTFDRVFALLEARGFLRGWALTDRGHQLVRIYHEADLLVAEALDRGLLDGLDPATLAGLVSCFVYEHRSRTPAPPPWFPSRRARERVAALESMASELNAAERGAGLPETRAPDPSFFALAHAWAAGEALDEVLGDEDVSGGDFVRNVKQLIDLLRQIGDGAAEPATARAARQAADALFRGVVAASSLIGTAEDDDVVATSESATPAP